MKSILLSIKINAKTNKDFDAAITDAMRESLECRKHGNMVVPTQQPTMTTDVESAAIGRNSRITLNVCNLPKDMWQNKPEIQYSSFKEGTGVKIICGK